MCGHRLLERPELRATAKVVGILEPSRRRGAIVGVLKEEPGGAALLLVPCDPRLPRCLVRSSELPPDIKPSLKASHDINVLVVNLRPAPWNIRNRARFFFLNSKQFLFASIVSLVRVSELPPKINSTLKASRSMVQLEIYWQSSVSFRLCGSGSKRAAQWHLRAVRFGNVDKGISPLQQARISCLP